MRRSTPLRLLPFVALSVAAHGALLVLLVRAPSEPLPGPPGTEVQVTLPLFPQRAIAPRAASRPAGSHLTAAPTVTAPVGFVSTTPPAVTSTPSEGAHDGAPARTAADGPEIADAAEARTQQVRRILWRALGAQFRYPLIARRNGWEGEVRLALVVGMRGQLLDIRIVRSSGYEILDEAAVEALHRLRRLPEAEAVLAGADLTLILPVRYRLVRG